MRKVWTYETCREEALKYKLRTEFMKNCPGAYNFARTNRWLDKFFDKPPVRKTAWTYETCREEAKKYKTKTEFGRGRPQAYNVAMKNKWMRDYDWFKRPEAHNKKWTYETCMEEAKKYERVTYFEKGSSGAFQAAQKNGWIKDYDWLAKNRRNYWNYETCMEEARKYKSITEFYKGCHQAYVVARQNNWMEEYVWFDRQKNKKKETGNKAKVFPLPNLTL